MIKMMRMRRNESKRQRRNLNKNATAVIIRMLPTVIILLSLIASLLIGYISQIAIPSSSSSLFHSSSTSSKRIPRLRIGAYYFWYDRTEYQWDLFQKQQQNNSQPTLGYYSSSNSTVLTKHTQWASQAGIDFFIMSWGDGSSTQQEDHYDVVKQYMQHPKSLRLALQIPSRALYLNSRVQNYTAQSTANDQTTIINFHEPCINAYSQKKEPFGEIFISRIIKAMQHIVVRYRHKYVFVGDRPVFILQDSYLFRNFEEYIDRIRRFFQTRFGVQPYFIVDAVVGCCDDGDGGGHEDDRNTNVLVQALQTSSGKDKKFDSITSSSNYNDCLESHPVKEELLERCLHRTGMEYRYYSNPSYWWDFLHLDDGKMEILPMVPCVQNVYSNEHMIRSDQPGRRMQPKTKDDGSTSCQTCDKFWDFAQTLLDSNPCTMKSDEWFVFVASFNNWFKGTAIEPSNKWDEQFLKLTKDRGKSLYPTCSAY